MPYNKKARFSLVKEDRVLDLLNQGYQVEHIAKIVNASPNGVYLAIKRINKRWKYPDDPRKGRQRGFLSDREVETIRQLYHGRYYTLYEIGQMFYNLSEVSILYICQGRTYAYDCKDESLDSFDFSDSFKNRFAAGARRD